MTSKEELKKEAEDWIGDYTSVPCSCMFLKYDYINLVEAYLASAEPREKRITDLEKEISNLLSCKNCPENKGGLLCQKEYEDKCLSQKIQYIKELKEENAELKEQLEICETNADTYYDELTKLQEQLVKTTQIGMTCSNCKWSQYDEDEMCYCCSDKDKWELKLRR